MLIFYKGSGGWFCYSDLKKDSIEFEDYDVSGLFALEVENQNELHYTGKGYRKKSPILLREGWRDTFCVRGL